MKLFRPRLSRRAFWVLCALLVCLRLALTGFQQAYIWVGGAPLDDELMFRAANHITAGQWLGAYDYLTLSKAMFFPVWLALLHALHLPYLISDAALWCGAALLAAFVIIPAMAAGGAQLDAGGPGLMFIYLVHVMNGMAGGRIVAMVFFVCVAFAGVTSIINLYEAPVASLQERFGLKRVPATAVIHVIGLAVALCIQAIVSQWMDVVSIYICPLGALLAAVMFFWIGGKKLVLESVNLGARKPIGGWYYPLCKYVYCASVLVALVAGAALGGIG